MANPSPFTEAQRLATLRRHGILDTLPEPSLDRIVRTVAQILDTQIAAITLVDESRVWIKAAHGTEVRETPREGTVCSEAIYIDGITVVEDASRDGRFANSPHVTGPSGFRFYAGAPLKGFNGAPIGMLCAVDTKPRQLTEIHRNILESLAQTVSTELNLRWMVTQRNMLESAVVNIGVGVVITDPRQAGNPIIYCNPAFTKITGYDRADAIGKSPRLLQGRKSDPEEQEKIRHAIRSGGSYRGRLLNYRKNDEPFWNDLVINPVFDQEGKLINFVGLQNDVTEQKKAEDALKENFERLKKLEKMRDSLTHMIVHDLRSPLGVTMGFLQLIKDEAFDKLDELGREAVGHALKSTVQMNTMITSLLDIGRLEAGKMPLKISKTDLAALARFALEGHLLLEGPGRIRLEFPETPVRVYCDAALVPRIINNLVGNALKFTPAPGTVRVRIEICGNEARMAVIDEGMGIPAESLGQIFEKFSQVEGTRRQHSTGLGLTFCKLALEAQRGNIGVESKKGQGSTFWFTLPLAS